MATTPVRARLGDALHIVREYSHLSSLHGLRHIVMKGTSVKEKVFWFLLVFGCGVELFVIVLDQVSDYRQVPTATVLTDNAASVLEEPFPCVGICPIHQVDRVVGLRLLRAIVADVNASLWTSYLPELQETPSSADQIVPSLDDSVLEEVLRALHYMVDPGLGFASSILARVNMSLVPLDALNLVDFMKRVFPACNTFFHSCLWRGMPFDCCKHFRTTATELGFCFFFDTKEANRMVCWEAFPRDDDQRHECMRTQSLSNFGPGAGLRVFIEAERDPDTAPGREAGTVLAKVSVRTRCFASSQSVLGSVHAHRARTYSLALRVQRTRLVPSLRSLPPTARGCHTADEWPNSTTRTRRSYPKEYDVLECTARCGRQLVLDTCDCITYPLTLGDPSAVCLLSKTSECIKNLTSWTRFIQPPQSAPGFSEAEHGHGLACLHCLPECESSRYVLDTRLPYLTPLESTPSVALLAPRTMIDVFWDGPNAATLYTITPTLTTRQLMVTFGAVANLFLGISYLTVLELIVVAGKCVWVFLSEWRGGPALWRPSATGGARNK